MTTLPFTKMQAQGNDFVVLDGLAHDLPTLDDAFVRRITERRYGIGCDQLLVLQPHPAADVAMRIFNNDGSEAANCGNGLRCAADLLMRRSGGDSVHIALADRIVQASRGARGVRIDMGAARIEDQTGAYVDVCIGNQHRVCFEATEEFPRDRNIEIVTGQVADHVYIDIIERGAGRTPACGSGACAVATAIWHVEGHRRPQTIAMPGGEVIVSGDVDNLILEGEVQRVFDGLYMLPEARQTVMHAG